MHSFINESLHEAEQDCEMEKQKKQNLLPPMVVGQHALYSYIENGKSDERRRYCMFRKHAFSPSQGGVWGPPPCEGGTGSSPFQYEMESVQLKAEIDLKSIYGLKLATPFKIHLTEQ